VKIMLKLIGSFIVIVAASLIGFSYATVYSHRVKHIREIQYALNMLESEIIYTSTPLIDALISIAGKSSENIATLLTKMAELLRDKRIDSVFGAFDEAYKQTKSELYFEKEEVDIIASFMQSLGNSDIEGQKKNFNITIKKLEGFEKKAEEMKAKNEKLFRYLGVCSGVLIVIILI
jgi:stage III sporulation protein AB